MRFVVEILFRSRAFLLFLALQSLSLFFLFRSYTYQKVIMLGWVQEKSFFMQQTRQKYADYVHLNQENETLKNENAALLNASGNFSYKNDAFALLSHKDTVQTINADSSAYRRIQWFQYTPAEVTYNNLKSTNNYILIDKGRKHGIAPDMGLMAANGIIGTVVDVSDDFSLALSVLNTASKISVRLKKNQYNGTMTWNGKWYKTVQVEDIPKHANVQNGDTIVSNKVSQIFPENIPIGVVKDVYPSKDGDYFIADVDLFADFDALRHVYVIKNLKKGQVDTLFLKHEIATPYNRVKNK
jgi:rod shape-determining protein MreC